MKKLTSLILLSVFILAGCKSAPIDAEQGSKKENTPSQNKEASKEEAPVKKVNKMCDWIDESDIIIQLELPEKYAQYENKTSFPSYNTGFLFKSSYGDQARSMRQAQKNCNYRVGFSKSDFLNLNMSPNSPFAIAAEVGKTGHFSYEGWPISIDFDENGIITNGMPAEGKTIIIKVTGEVRDAEQYNQLFD